MSGLNVLVVGASIAGPATAYWLAKAGARVTVVERFNALRTGGQNIDIRTAGVSVMRKMPGMEERVRAKTTGEEGVSFVRDDGRPYGVIRATGNPDQQSLISEYEIFRGDLAKILHDLSLEQKNVEYVFGEQVASMRQSEKAAGPINIEFANGTASSDYDLVVAADGATSRTRAMGFSCGVRDPIISTNTWAAYFSIKSDIQKGGRIAQGYSAPGGRSISVGADPSGADKVMFMDVQRRDGRDRTAPFRQAAAEGDIALREYIAGRYRDVGWKSQLMTRELMDSEDFYASEIVQVNMPRLHTGRFVLVGDAGYAAGLTGGGTSLALSGAYMLAGELNKHSGDVAAGLQSYEERMRPLITEFQKIPPFITTFLAPQTASGIWWRNQIFAFIAWTGIAEFLQRALGGGFASTKAYPLPEYKWADEKE